MRFILIRATARAALEATASLQARLLQPGEALAWRELAGDTCFVVPLIGEPAAAPTPQAVLHT
jgi:cyclic beta-1,2-glucan synthetase